jgi:hypothetical protein
MNDLKAKAFEIRRQIDICESKKNQLIQEYNKLVIDITEKEKENAAPQRILEKDNL